MWAAVQMSTYAPRATKVREHVFRRGRRVFGHIAPAAIVIIAVGELNRTRAVLALGVDVRAARQQFVDDARSAASSPPNGSADWIAHRRHAAARARRRAGFRTFARSRSRIAAATASPSGDAPCRLANLRLQQPLHLRVSTVASDLEQAVVDRQTERIGAVLEQEGGDLELVLPHGEVDRRAVA